MTLAARATLARRAATEGKHVMMHHRREGKAQAPAAARPAALGEHCACWMRSATTCSSLR
jgi:hypothetical protein